MQKFGLWETKEEVVGACHEYNELGSGCTMSRTVNVKDDAY